MINIGINIDSILQSVTFWKNFVTYNCVSKSPNKLWVCLYLWLEPRKVAGWYGAMQGNALQKNNIYIKSRKSVLCGEKARFYTFILWKNCHCCCHSVIASFYLFPWLIFIFKGKQMCCIHKMKTETINTKFRKWKLKGK